MSVLKKKDILNIDVEILNTWEKDALIRLIISLIQLVLSLFQRLERNSTNSSNPPSSDSPYDRQKKRKEKSGASANDNNEANSGKKGSPDPNSSDGSNCEEETSEEKTKRPPGKQKGAKGYWRKEKPVPEKVVPHYPDRCDHCGQDLSLPPNLTPRTGFYTFELEGIEQGNRISCTLHHYYAIECDCGHLNIAEPGRGYISEIEGRKRNLQLTENNMVGPRLATFIAALNRRYGMSRKKIREFLLDWFGFELSAGTICKCIREAGIACFPVQEQLIEELQKAGVIHLDETPWFQKGCMLWLWVAISSQAAVYVIGSRKKEVLLELITEAFFGWLVTDGYRAYRSHTKRQRCLAHIIRKAIALTGVGDKEAEKMADWLLRELRAMIHEMAQGEDGAKKCRPILARLKRACLPGSKSDHPDLKALAKEILNDWDAMVAFVKNPELPPTNNEAERALRCAVIFRKITFGTRTSEGSRSFAALLSVIETCRLRNINPWDYITEVIAAGRKGISPPPIPAK